MFGEVRQARSAELMSAGLIMFKTKRYITDSP